MPRLSLFLITFNEEENLGRCLEAAKDICDEIIVVDSGSTDKTREIAEKYGARFYTRKFDGFAAQKGYALSQCSGEWALSLDADEVLDEELKAEIRSMAEGGDSSQSADGYEILRVNYFLGRRMRHSGLKNDIILRLVRREKAKFTGGIVHEKLEVSGGNVKMIEKGHLKHFSYSSIHNYFEKFNKYTTLGAKKKAESGRNPNLFVSFIRIPFDFFRRYILQLGILDGAQGFIWCSFSSFYPFVKYMKWWEINKISSGKKFDD